MKVLITGGAGFIGGHAVDRLLAEGHQVTAYDNLSTGSKRSIEHHLDESGFALVIGDLLDAAELGNAMRGQDLVWHLAANTDIRGGARQTDADLKNTLIATWNVLEAMRLNGVNDLIFASSGVVYGDIDLNPVTESAGPLLPISLYAAGKLSCENFISAYSHLFGPRAWIFRFANVIGGRATHGVVYDFVQKLRRSPEELEVLGDGNQLKPYFLVEECIDGMLFAYRNIPLPPEHPCDVFNLGTDTVTRVEIIAHIVREEMGLPDARIRYTGGRRGWPGDAPVLRMSVEKIRSHGWVARHTSDEAVRIAARRLIAELVDAT